MTRFTNSNQTVFRRPPPAGGVHYLCQAGEASVFHTRLEQFGAFGRKFCSEFLNLF